MAKFRKKPVVIDAICWQGGDFEILNAFCGKNWGRAVTRQLKIKFKCSNPNVQG